VVGLRARERERKRDRVRDREGEKRERQGASEREGVYLVRVPLIQTTT
jgi:hypothetical protein